MLECVRSARSVQMAPSNLITLVAYPAVFQLHGSEWGGTRPDGAFALPPTVPASVRFLDAAGAYLVDAAYVAFLWLGASAPQSLVRVRPLSNPACAPVALSLIHI